MKCNNCGIESGPYGNHFTEWECFMALRNENNRLTELVNEWEKSAGWLAFPDRGFSLDLPDYQQKPSNIIVAPADIRKIRYLLDSNKPTGAKR